ncbi:MAG: hypothetical protein A3J75_02730 [Acidobacteria bacterium RBG_16_68_9]|nr:MAG: hypothetical protein A3J75_02730 [Acidobacteria bacterium RBG_16_68_9]
MEWFADNPVMRLFGIAYLILVLKMVALGSYTSFLRIRHKVYATPEDYRFLRLSPAAQTREDIERARRAHRNDLENILPFFGVGLLYAFTGPSATAAAVYYLGFAAARVAHSILYVGERQPHRTIAYGIGLTLMLAMTFSTLVSLF